MRKPTFDFDAYQFMREHAGYSYRPSVETAEQGHVHSALALARAEKALSNSDAWVEWEDDPMGDANGEHPSWIASLRLPRLASTCDESMCLASLGGIDAPAGHPYRRVVEAELALEAGICHPLDRSFPAVI